MTKKRLVFRGLRRQLLRKLQNACLSIQKMDLRTFLKANEDDHPSFYFAETDTSKEAKAIQTCLDRVDELLVLKA